jgi:hypothetical protein
MTERPLDLPEMFQNWAVGVTITRMIEGSVAVLRETLVLGGEIGFYLY